MNPIKYLLLASYSFVKRWGRRNIITGAVHVFTQAPLFLILGLWLLIIGSLSFKVKYSLEIFGLIILVTSFSIRWFGKKYFYIWNIENEYLLLSKKQRRIANTFIFIFLIFSFSIFFYLGATFYGGYDKKFQN